MSKKLSGNGLWESSRMMLPQHKERIIADQKRETKRKKPILHEDEWEEMSRCIAEYIKNKDYVSITLYGEYDNTIIQGYIHQVSEQRKSIRIESDVEDRWIPLLEIIKVERE